MYRIVGLAGVNPETSAPEYVHPEQYPTFTAAKIARAEMEAQGRFEDLCLAIWPEEEVTRTQAGRE